jgi:hypothetical protein
VADNASSFIDEPTVRYVYNLRLRPEQKTYGMHSSYNQCPGKKTSPSKLIATIIRTKSRMLRNVSTFFSSDIQHGNIDKSEEANIEQQFYSSNDYFWHKVTAWPSSTMRTVAAWLLVSANVRIVISYYRLIFTAGWSLPASNCD